MGQLPEQPDSDAGNESKSNGSFIGGLNAWLDRQAAVFSPVPPAPEVGGGQMSAADEKTWGMMCHLLALSAVLTGIGFIVGPLIPWLVKRSSSPFVDAHGKESINFQISSIIFALILAAIVLVIAVLTCGTGMAIAPVVSLLATAFWLYVVIRAGIMANEGRFMAYPFSIRFIK